MPDRKINRRLIREIEIIFKNCPKNVFHESLEIGAGDGAQSVLLKKYTEHLYAVDYNVKRLRQENSPGITYKICDAEKIDSYFNNKQFDFVFSSSLLEHLPNVGMTLNGISRILKDDGITIHCMPNPLWKILNILLFYPNMARRIIEVLFRPGRVKEFIVRKVKKGIIRVEIDESVNNNPKIKSRKYSRLWPTIHGAYENHIHEILSYRKKNWIKIFENSGYDIYKILPGPVSTGYQFRFSILKRIIEKMSISTEYIYLAIKRGNSSEYTKYI
ncbi:MAG: class I SAM-dependent methyltransferase [Elusimicrobiota bacterium]